MWICLTDVGAKFQLHTFPLAPMLINNPVQNEASIIVINLLTVNMPPTEAVSYIKLKQAIDFLQDF